MHDIISIGHQQNMWTDTLKTTPVEPPTKSGLSGWKRQSMTLGLAMFGIAGCSVESECGTVTIAEMTWQTAAFAAHVEQTILESGFGCLAETVPGNTVPTVTAMVERGEPDVAPEVWMNSVRSVVERGIEDERVQIATDIITDGGNEGWYVPEFAIEQYPELATIEGVRSRPDLFPDKEEPGKGRFYTCPPGWACQIINENLFRAFEMEEAGFTVFNPGSGEGLNAAIARAFERREPILAYFYTPTPLAARYPMRMIESVPHDPDTWPCMTTLDCENPVPNTYPKSVVRTLVTTTFAEKSPEAYAFLTRVSWTNAFLTDIMGWQEEEQATAKETAMHFLRTREDMWAEWVPEDIAARVRASL